ncbi:MAG: bifunctional diaminohydroxyphosphoribosylaminopyrimidine deaminase/5-amino-6-(5-phosphoribosylamino)uracil reductase RibD [Candidatus Omnitrophota bacterium]|nr:MAG: bifunctional diaminohydroxyphosphoribosylaminopyrimidine deaminase/5-amino-6-(5-phosphoribosylamino)uracil reductase RibD [Candidatus Omnitrophota bacterium]
MREDLGMKSDAYFIEKTINLAKKAEGFTSPNPLVGAVLVRNNKIIAQGYHKKAGLPHAEIEAIKRGGSEAKGATLYVNLEPCYHYGRTPPCVGGIIKAGIKKVVIATSDPNPLVKGKSMRKLKNAGIEVKLGPCIDEAKRLNEVFFKNIKEKRPFVVAKLAQTLDGKIATRSGSSKWITSEKARHYARSLRDKYDCVLVGVNTVINDNPHLNGLKKIPLKAVIDPRGRISHNSYLVRKNPQKLFLFTSSTKGNKLKNIPAKVKIFNLDKKKGLFNLKELLRILYARGITSVFVEGGSQTLGRFFDQKLIDKIHLFLAPKIMGGKDSITSIGAKGFSLKKCPVIKEVSIKRIGQDILISGYPVYK